MNDFQLKSLENELKKKFKNILIEQVISKPGKYGWLRIEFDYKNSRREVRGPIYHFDKGLNINKLIEDTLDLMNHSSREMTN